MTTLAAVRRRSPPLVRAVPAWAWLAGLVAVSAGIRFQLARGFAAPWILVDELVYSELAKSLARGDYLVRDLPTGAYGLVYPLLLAPAYRAFTAVPDAYLAAKAVNAVVMSLAAVPAYLLARRVLAPAWSLGAAVLALALPAYAYTGSLMTENAFYPAFLTAVLALVLALERPTAARQAGVVAACGLALLVRVQAVALVPAVLLAPVVLDRLERRPWRELRRFRLLYGAVLGGAFALLVGQLARGRSLRDLFGAYRAAVDGDYDVGGVARWLLYHVAELDLAVAVAPFAAALLLAFVARRLDRPARVFVVAAGCVSLWLLLEVAAFASLPSVGRVQERNLFYLQPLFLLALLVWLQRGAPRPRAGTAAVVVAAAALPAALPLSRLLAPAAVADSLSLLPWWWVRDNVVGGAGLRVAAAGAAAVVALAVGLAPRTALLALPFLLLGWLAVVGAVVLDGVHGVREASAGARAAGIGNASPDWIDRAVGPRAEVAAVWTGRVPPHAIWENEFFNRSVGPIFHLAAPLPGGLPETRVAVDAATGAVVPPVRARYVLVDGSLAPAGEAVARDEARGLAVYRLDGPFTAATLVDGLYDGDTWSGPEVVFRRLRCSGGSVTVTLAGDRALFPGGQTVAARVGGEVVARATLVAGATQRLRVPLRAGAGGECAASFAVSPTAVPAASLAGSTDRRELGAHFLGLAYSR